LNSLNLINLTKKVKLFVLVLDFYSEKYYFRALKKWQKICIARIMFERSEL